MKLSDSGILITYHMDYKTGDKKYRLKFPGLSHVYDNLTKEEAKNLLKGFTPQDIGRHLNNAKFEQ
jgi:hypothetical protein